MPVQSIRGTRPPSRVVPGGGIPAAQVATRVVETLGVPVAASGPVLAPVFTAGAGVPIAPPIQAPTPLGRMKNAELRGKIARLERDNRILAEQVATLTLQLQEALK